MHNPYVTGAYVTGPRHYGREELLQTLLRGGSRAYWVIGSRRTGRTSLLRQLETLTVRRSRLVPLYWDMQAAATSRRLGHDLAAAVSDQRGRFDALGLPAALAEEEDALTLLTHLRRLALRKGRELLLLCDETESLVELARTEPEFMQRLHRELTLGAGLRAVLVSTRRAYHLHDACAGWTSAPFLNGFDMTATLGGLSAAAARSLILQAQAPRGSRVKAPAAVVSAIRDAAQNHPFLLQWLCAALFQSDGSLRLPVAEDLRVAPALAGLFEHDFRQLSEAEQHIVLAVAAAERAGLAELQKATGQEGGELRLRVAGLEAQGFLRRLTTNYAIGNAFFAAWLAAEGARGRAADTARPSASALAVVLARQRENDAAALAEQLNARRGRLVELEVQRAREFLHLPPQVLAEIAQLESEIAELRSLLVRRAAA